MSKKKTKKVCVLGLGYIGLPTASILASKGYQVIGVDVVDKVVETINRGEIHIEEPGLDLLVRSAVNSGHSPDWPTCLATLQSQFGFVPTEFDASNASDAFHCCGLIELPVQVDYDHYHGSF